MSKHHGVLEVLKLKCELTLWQCVLHVMRNTAGSCRRFLRNCIICRRMLLVYGASIWQGVLVDCSPFSSIDTVPFVLTCFAKVKRCVCAVMTSGDKICKWSYQHELELSVLYMKQCNYQSMVHPLSVLESFDFSQYDVINTHAGRPGFTSHYSVKHVVRWYHQQIIRCAWTNKHSENVRFCRERWTV